MLLMSCANHISYETWLPHKSYKHSTAFASAVEIAKKNYLSRYPNNNRKMEYEYRVSEEKNGFIVTIDFIIINNDGTVTMALDSRDCTYLDKSLQFKGAWQCMVFRPNPLVE